MVINNEEEYYAAFDEMDSLCWLTMHRDLTQEEHNRSQELDLAMEKYENRQEEERQKKIAALKTQT